MCNTIVAAIVVFGLGMAAGLMSCDYGAEPIVIMIACKLLDMSRKQA